MNDNKPNLFDTDKQAAKSPLVPTRHLSRYAGKRFRLDYIEGRKHGTVIGRIADLQPAMDNDKVVGVTIRYWPGSFKPSGKGSFEWAQEQNPVTHTVGPFTSITLLKYELRLDKSQKDADIVEWGHDSFELTGPTRRGEFKLLD